MPNESAAKVVKFYMRCVEAEAAMQVRFKPGAPGHIELKSGKSPVHGRCVLPDRKDVKQMCEKLQESDDETILAGWPLVLGHDRDSGSAGTVVSPLLIADVSIRKGADGWSSFPESGVGVVDLNPFALDLLVGSREEREALMSAVWKTPAVEEASSSSERADRMLEVLAGAKIAGLEGLAPGDLTGIGQEFGVHNAGLVFRGGAAPGMTGMLVQDLKLMHENAKTLRSGPASVMLGLVPAPQGTTLVPHPTLLPSTLAQDRAVASAMSNLFTVVTGPPGTGKSQVLVNTISAAVASGQKVLFASKNNQAVDVVFERLALTSDDPCIVRAGAKGKRGEVASRILHILAVSPKEDDASAAHERWHEIRSEVGAIHVAADERASLEQERLQAESDLQRLTESQWQIEDLLRQMLTEETSAVAEPEPAATADTDAEQSPTSMCRIDTAPVMDALEMTSDLIAGIAAESRNHRPSRSRIKSLTSDAVRAREILAEAQKTIARWGAAEEPIRAENEATPDIKTLDETPPVDTSDPLRQKLEAIQEQVNEATGRIRSIREHVGRLPEKHELNDRLQACTDTRAEAGRSFIDARWEQIRRSSNNDTARRAAGDLAQHLRASSKGEDFRLNRAHAQVKDALPLLPVWGVTNLSARTNLPLTVGMFDLVIIDEAPQCDVASALPLLMRAKRAMIIGDICQLNHITNISRGREDIIGKQAGLTEDDLADFSYRSRSCFSLAASRLQEEPIFLDLHFRSHPAIIGFPNQEFYDERLEFCSANRPPLGAKAITWESVDGKCSRGSSSKSFRNLDEARAVVDLVAVAFPEYEGLGVSVGVVTPFRAQNDLIRELLSKALGADPAQKITVGTVHRYQGDERDVIFFSPVIAPPYVDQTISFASDPNLVNVAMTRAKRRFVVVGNRKACVEQQGVLADLAAYISRLDAGMYDSPVEEMLANALRERGVHAQTGQVAAGHRLDLAVTQGDRRLDIECDGAAFHTDHEHDEERDKAISDAGWEVLRFSGRRVCNDLVGCVDTILAGLARKQSARDDEQQAESRDETVLWPWEQDSD